MTETLKNIVIEELSRDYPDLSLKKRDFIATYPVDFYSGTGIYEMETNGRTFLARCLEKTDGMIHVSEVGTASGQTFAPQDFCKNVNRKIFAKITLENNLPSIAIGELRDILSTRS